MASALFGKAVKSDAPMLEANTQGDQPKSRFWESDERTGGLAESIADLFGN